ncbi:MAG: SGNH/GDSL hydrolase family protein [Chloroflexi bacterium]|nr:SGNH/GDSL hydrolase family protein [Chloroflexota bacterium]
MWGVASYTGNSGGIGFALLASAGDSVHTWNPSKEDPLGREFLLAGPSYIGNTGFGFPVGPHLAIITFGANDALIGTPIQAYRDGLTAFIQAIRLNLSTASIALLAMNIPATGLDPASPFHGVAARYLPYVGVLQSVAQRYGCAFLDFHAKWGPDSIADGLAASNGHPTDLGHQDIATSLCDALGLLR